MFKIIAPSKIKLLQVSNWKDDSSKIIKPSFPGSVKDDAAFPIFPPT